MTWTTDNPHRQQPPYFRRTDLLTVLLINSIHHSSAGFPPSTYVIPPPVAFPGLPVNPGFTFSTGVSVPGPFLQSAVHTQAGTPVQAGKQSHIPYSQQRPSGPGPGQGPGSSGQGPGPMNQGPPQVQQPQAQTPSQQALQQSVQLQVQAMSQQQQQSPTKPVGLGKSPPHHPGLQQVRSHVSPELFSSLLFNQLLQRSDILK